MPLIMMSWRVRRKALIDIYMDPAARQQTEAECLLEQLRESEPSEPRHSDQLRPLLVALGCALAGGLPVFFGYDDSVLWLAWIAIIALPAGILCRAAGLPIWPFGLVAPAGWMILLAYLEMKPGLGLPNPAWAATASVGLFMLGTALGALAKGAPFRGAGLGICIVFVFAWLPLASGQNKALWGGRPLGQMAPGLAAELFDLSPMTLLIESAGVDWMRHPTVYNAAGTEWFSDRRRPFDGKLTAPIMLLIGSMGAFLTRSRRTPS